MKLREHLAERIRGYWGVENKVHYVRDVTQGEDASRIRTTPINMIFAIAYSADLSVRSQFFTQFIPGQYV